MADAPAIAAVLISPSCRAAVAAGETGMAVRLIRQAVGWSQQDLANRSGYSQATISRLEREASRAARDTAVLIDLAEALGVPPAALGVVSGPGHRPILGGVDRRDFLGGTVGLAVTALLPQSMTAPGRIDADTVAQCWTGLRRLVELDDHQGGGTAFHLAEEMVRRLRVGLRQGSYSSTVGRELQNVTASTMEHAGWLAYDAGWHHQARHWWLEASHLADLAGIPEARVTALASMALQASDAPAGGRETVALAHAARSTARDRATPTLLSLLSAREAVGHARTGDRGAASSSIAEARRWLDRGRRGDEPFWLDFWGPADLACHETRVALATGNGRAAESAARAALTNVDKEAFPRNHTLYTARLGSVLTQLGQLDEAIDITSKAIEGVHAVRGSRRIVSDLHRTVDLLERQKYLPATTFAGAARRLLPAST